MSARTSPFSLKSNKLAVQLVLLIFILVLFSIVSPYFLSVTNFMNVLNQMVEVGLIAIPMTMIIISGAMDSFGRLDSGFLRRMHGRRIRACVSIFGSARGLVCWLVYYAGQLTAI